MTIILAPDSFKESLSAVEAANAMKAGILQIAPHAEIIALPLADGGEGTVRALVTAAGGELIVAKVTGPLGEPVPAEYGIIDNGATAVIEMAAASGLSLVPPQKRNPLYTTTFGTGELIKKVIEQGCQNIIIGIGGSATNDGGAGLAQALGVVFTDHHGRTIETPMCGDLLGSVAELDTSACDALLSGVTVHVACDVTNPLLGDNGAAAVYAPQKGADAEIQTELETNMRHFIDRVEETYNMQVREIPGAGAAGGLGAGLLAFCHAELSPGIDLILDAIGFDDYLPHADLVITGEGQIDGQSVHGKTIMGVLQRCNKANIPVIALAGTIGDQAEKLYKHGLTGMFSICKSPMSLDDALANASGLLSFACRNVMAVWMTGRIKTGTRMTRI